LSASKLPTRRPLPGHIDTLSSPAHEDEVENPSPDDEVKRVPKENEEVEENKEKNRGGHERSIHADFQWLGLDRVHAHPRDFIQQPLEALSWPLHIVFSTVSAATDGAASRIVSVAIARESMTKEASKTQRPA